MSKYVEAARHLHFSAFSICDSRHQQLLGIGFLNTVGGLTGGPALQFGGIQRHLLGSH